MEQTANPQLEILQRVKSGFFRNDYLIYCRKSTDEPDNQKNSIKYQRAENRRGAIKEGLTVAPVTVEGFCRDGIIAERHSGFKEDVELFFGNDKTVKHHIERPKFYQLVHWLHNGYFKGAIFLCWDRASRNKGDAHILRKLMKAGVDIRFVLARYDKTSSGELHMDIDSVFSEHHSRVTAEKVTLTFQDLLSRGYWPHKAPVGYLNPGSTEHKPMDETRAPLILEFAKLAASGRWSLADIARWAVEQGFTMPPVRRPRTKAEILAEEDDDLRLQIEKTTRLPTANTIHKILTNRYYTGFIPLEDGRWIPSQCHEAIIPLELFDQVQRQLRERNRSSHYVRRLPHPFRGLIKCAICRRAYCPYLKKDILYYGVRCATHCTNPRKIFNFRFIDAKIVELLECLPFTCEEVRELKAETDLEINERASKEAERMAASERKLRKLREDLAYLNVNRLSLLKAGVFTPEAMVAEETRLKAEISMAEVSNQSFPAETREAIEAALTLSELLKSVVLYYKMAKPAEKEAILRNIVSELTLSGETLQPQYKIGINALAGRFAPLGDPKVWISELLESRMYNKLVIRELFVLLND